MNLRDLKYLVAVAETKNFSQAAVNCFVSQPTLSGQIKKLERELGITLFERTNRSVEITEIGMSILAHARQILEQADVIAQLARAHQDPLSGPLRVGAIPTLSPYLMPLILAPLKQQHPQMQLVLSEEITETLLTRLHHHEIDVAVLATAVNDPALTSIPLFDEPFWVAFPSEHRLYNKEKINRADIVDESLLLLSEGHCLSTQVMDVCNMKQRHSEGDMADLRAASLETLIQLVKAGYGITLIPALALSGSWTSGSGVIMHPLNIKSAFRRVSLVFRNSFPRRQALDAFAKIIVDRLPNTVKKLASMR